MAKYKNWNEYVKSTQVKKRKEEQSNTRKGMTDAKTWDEYVDRNKMTGFKKEVKWEPREEEEKNQILAELQDRPVNKMERRTQGNTNERAKGNNVQSVDRKNYRQDPNFNGMNDEESERYEILKTLDHEKAQKYVNELAPVIAKRKAEGNYVTTNIAAGARQTGEGIQKLGREVVEDFFENKRDLTDEEMARTEAQDVYRNRLNEINQGRGKLGKFGADVLQGVGQALPGMVAATVSGPLGLATFAAGAAGNYLDEAEKAGATKGQKWAYGLTMGGVEAALEKSLGMFGFDVDGAIMPLIRQGLKKNLGTLAKHFAKNAAGEGTEEFAAEIIGALMQKATYDPDRKLDGQLLKDAGYSALVGATSGAGMYMGQMPGNAAAMKYGPQYLQEEFPKSVVAAMSLPETYESNKIVSEMIETSSDISIGELEKLNKLIEKDMKKFNEEIKSGKFDAEIFKETMRENNEIKNEPDNTLFSEAQENEVKESNEVSDEVKQTAEQPQESALDTAELKQRDEILKKMYPGLNKDNKYTGKIEGKAKTEGVFQHKDGRVVKIVKDDGEKVEYVLRKPDGTWEDSPLRAYKESFNQNYKPSSEESVIQTPQQAQQRDLEQPTLESQQGVKAEIEDAQSGALAQENNIWNEIDEIESRMKEIKEIVNTKYNGDPEQMPDAMSRENTFNALRLEVLRRRAKNEGIERPSKPEAVQETKEPVKTQAEQSASKVEKPAQTETKKSEDNEIAQKTEKVISESKTFTPLTQSTNSKTGDTIYEFELKERIEKEQWSEINGMVKRLKGGYWKNKFYFRTDNLDEATEKYNQIIAKFDKTEPVQTVKNEVIEDNQGIQETKEKTYKDQTKELSEMLIKRFESGVQISNKELFEIANVAFGGTQGEGKYNVKDAYDSLELAVNKYILDMQEIITLTKMQDILELLPTQSNRTEEQEQFQQFSTPPSIAYVANYAANIDSSDVMLEPSAGIGGLAVFAKKNGAKVYANEFSERRLEVLKNMPFDGFFNENAEQLDNILPDYVKPSVVVMNPPFSATAGRLNKNSTKYAKMHIEQALARLEEGGRLVAIVGRGMAHDSTTFRDWWTNVIGGKYNIRANIGIDGNNYKKYGTTFDIQIVVIDKNGPTQNDVMTGFVEDISELPIMLEGIRNDRKRIEQQTSVKNVAGNNEGVKNQSRPEPSGNTSSSGMEPGQPGSTVRQGQSELQNASGEVVSNSSGENVDVRNDDGGRKPRGTRKGNVPGDQIGEKTGTENVGADGYSVQQFDGKSAIEIDVKTDEESREGNENIGDDAIYSNYIPKKLKIKGAKPHITPLVESAAMAAVEPPTPTYSPMLNNKIIEDGILSLPQLENVVYSGQAHEKILPNGERQGYLIGDGTGVGKGRQIAGIIMDNYNRGRKKAVWMTVRDNLYEDAIRDWTALGGEEKQIIHHAKVKVGQPIKQSEGILFSTYTKIRSKNKLEDMNEKERLKQIVNWLGKDFDGVIAFDEAHTMGNALEIKKKRGTSKPSATALSALQLKKALPKARVLYVTATAATDITQFAYATRLGLWGEGTAFTDVRDFVSRIDAGGLAALELVARDMKSMGLYLARNLSFDGVEYDTLTHDLSDMQRMIYSKATEAWQIVLQNIDAALEMTGAKNNGKAKKNALGAFWGANQRFFNQVMTSMSVPSLIEDIHKELDSGNVAVIQLVNTNEAAMERSLSEAEDKDIDLEDLDMSPTQILVEYLKKSFPIQQHEDYIDENGNKQQRLVKDSEGNIVINREAARKRDELIAEVEMMKMPDGAIDMIIDEFGPEIVSEITGRKRRLVYQTNAQTGKKERVEEKRSKLSIDKEVDQFQNGEKKILIFSDAGGTGKSYHADKNAKNQSKRIHYLLQAGWNAIGATQGFGRTHRSNQVVAPTLRLVTTDLKGQKRFVSTIARRLNQLGAITKGQRQTGAGIFSEKDNLEGPLASDVLSNFYEALATNRLPGIDGRDIISKMGLTSKFYDEYNRYKPNNDDPRNIPLFLNRLLNLDYDDQNSLFDLFIESYENAVNRAIANGTLDTGLENYKAERVEFIYETTIYEDKNTSAKTKYIQLKAYKKSLIRSYQDVTKHDNFIKFVRLNETGEVKAVWKSSKETDSKTGEVRQRYRLLPPMYGGSENVYIEETMKEKTTDIPKDQWRDEWKKASDTQPKLKEETLHMFSGTLLPIWDKLPDKNARVLRVTDDSGNVYLGRIFPTDEIDIILSRFDVKRTRENADANKIYDQVLNGKKIAQFNRRTYLERRKVSGEYRIEIKSPEAWYIQNSLSKFGAFKEKINSEDRFFIPTDKEKGTKAIESMMIRYEFESFATSMESENVPDAFQGKSPDKMGIVPPSIANSIAVPETEKYEYFDPDREKAHKENRLQKKNLGTVIREFAQHFKRISTRTFKDIDERDSSLAEARKEILAYKTYRSLAADEAARHLNLFVQADSKELSKEEYNRFERYIQLRDLMEDAKNNLTLPGSWTEEMVEFEYNRLSASLNDNIKAAVKRRDEGLERIKNDYIQALAKVGFNVKKRFTKENYFRHQVLEYYNANEMVKGSGSRVKINTNRGNLKKREGTKHEINENYLEAEYEVLFNMIYDTKVAQMLNRIRSKYDITSKLKKEAKSRNESMIVQIAEAEMQQALDKASPGEKIKLKSISEYTETKNLTGLRSDTAEAMVKFSQRIAMSMGSLQGLAERYVESGEGLWSGDGRWDRVIETIAEGNTKDTPQFFNFLSELASDDEFDGSLEARSILAAIGKREAFIKDTLGSKYYEWRNRVDDRLIPDDHSTFQPIQGKHMMSVNTISDQMAEVLMNISIGETIGIENLNKKDLQVKQMLSFAGDRMTYIIPTPVTTTLEDVYSNMTKEIQLFKQLWGKLQTGWKRWILTINPRQVVKYNLRNISGDLDALIGIAGFQPLKYTARASREIYDQIKFEAFTPELKEFFDRGGFQSDIIAQEIIDINEVKLFKRYRKPTKFDTLMKLPSSYMEFTGNLTRHREAILRYAAYLYFKDVASKKMDYYYASKPEIIKGLESVEDKAFQLSDDVMGAYDQVTELGQGLRKYLLLFYSFQETNFKRYYQALRNAKDYEKLNTEIGKSLSKQMQIKMGTKALAKLGYIGLRMMFLTAMLDVWNKVIMKDEDDELPEDVRTRPHITLGRYNDEILYFSKLGALTDLMDWFALDTLQQDIEELGLGRMTAAEMIKTRTQAPFNKLIGMISPFIKSPFELMYGSSLYPDPSTPTRIRDKGQYLASSLGLREEYDRIKGLPVSKSYMESFIKAFIYTTDPGQSAYYKTLDLKSKFETVVQKKAPSTGFSDSATSKALYYMKLSLKYGDEKNALKFLEQYYENGGTDKGLKLSLNWLDPFYGLDEDEQVLFEAWLTPQELETIKRGKDWYLSIQSEEFEKKNLKGVK
ncbi:MAG: hypothetical protein GT601_06060 [Acidaminobacter sp.]|uniref:strawberry notch-like NTP hydrolase domain-containing protein n=1 Tax=Acidaminobacter sp. TaxID=1872102 RepID=UPI001381BA31|nr:strawberry notch family protein [Acidaminobacter sp.]MZQ97220.1 hypothetical protein [Acidaminobacter sp.]